MTYEKIFSDVKKAFSKSDKKKLNRDFALQFNILGEGNGIFFVEYKNSVLNIQPYDYNDKDSTLFAGGDVFIKLANGVLSLGKAVEDGFLTVDGDFEAAREIEKLALVKTAAGKTVDKTATAKSLDERAASKKAEVKKTSEKKSDILPVEKAIKAAAAKQFKTAKTIKSADADYNNDSISSANNLINTETSSAKTDPAKIVPVKSRDRL